jgi:hypothetical protein
MPSGETALPFFGGEECVCVRRCVWVCSGRRACGCFEVIQHDAAYVRESGSDGGAREVK